MPLGVCSSLRSLVEWPGNKPVADTRHGIQPLSVEQVSVALLIELQVAERLQDQPSRISHHVRFTINIEHLAHAAQRL